MIIGDKITLIKTKLSLRFSGIKRFFTQNTGKEATISNPKLTGFISLNNKIGKVMPRMKSINIIIYVEQIVKYNTN